MAASEPTAPLIRSEGDFRYPHGGGRIGPAWVWAWNQLFGPGGNPMRRDEAAAAIAARFDLSGKTTTNLLWSAQKAGLLVQARPKRRRTDPPWLIRATLDEPPPEYAVRECTTTPERCGTEVVPTSP